MNSIRRWLFRSALILGAGAAMAAVAPAALEAQKVCTKGKPCGNTCIAANKTCRVGTGTATQGNRAPAAAPATRSVQVPEGMQYAASTRGSTYYYVGCSGWRSLSPSNLRWFETREDAEKAGLRPSAQAGCAGPPQAPAASGAAVGGPSVPGVTFAATCVVARIIDNDTFACDGGERVRLLLPSGAVRGVRGS